MLSPSLHTLIVLSNTKVKYLQNGKLQLIHCYVTLQHLSTATVPAHVLGPSLRNLLLGPSLVILILLGPSLVILILLDPSLVILILLGPSLVILILLDP